jgi:hypothetical protein
VHVSRVTARLVLRADNVQQMGTTGLLIGITTSTGIRLESKDGVNDASGKDRHGARERLALTPAEPARQ